MACKNDKLIATIKAKVEPTPELIELLRRYRDGLKMAIRWAVEEAKAKDACLRYPRIRGPLQNAEGHGSVVATCNREALAVVKSYLANGARASRRWLSRCICGFIRVPTASETATYTSQADTGPES